MRRPEPTNAEDALHLRTILQEMDKQFPAKKKLSAAAVAASGRVELAYFEYGRFSLDAFHCLVTALGRHVQGETVDGRRELMINVVPHTPTREVLSTYRQRLPGADLRKGRRRRAARTG